MNNQPVVVVSRCLLGEQVRYDGREKSHSFIKNELHKYFSVKAVCPEVEIGLGVPRDPMHLRRRQGKVRAVLVKNEEIEFTDRLENHAQASKEFFRQVDGVIFKARSPSCGVGSVAEQSGQELVNGVFANRIIEMFPGLPVTEETCLDDEAFRENFFQQVRDYFKARKV